MGWFGNKIFCNRKIAVCKSETSDTEINLLWYGITTAPCILNYSKTTFKRVLVFSFYICLTELYEQAFYDSNLFVFHFRIFTA